MMANGAHEGNRTPDPRLKRPLLYRLSYMSISPCIAGGAVQSGDGTPALNISTDISVPEALCLSRCSIRLRACRMTPTLVTQRPGRPNRSFSCFRHKKKSKGKPLAGMIRIELMTNGVKGRCLNRLATSLYERTVQSGNFCTALPVFPGCQWRYSDWTEWWFLSDSNRGHNSYLPFALAN